jgi:acyl dehydratase
MAGDRIARLAAMERSSLGTSSWLTIDQAMIDAHAEVTGDRDWLHNDPERARRDSPFGTTIAQGSLLLGNLVRFQEQVLRTVDDPAIAYALNYGFDRIRFVTPVPAGSRVRAHFEVGDVHQRDDGAVVIVLDVRYELEGSDRPALVAEWLGLIQPTPDPDVDDAGSSPG